MEPRAIGSIEDPSLQFIERIDNVYLKMSRYKFTSKSGNLDIEITKVLVDSRVMYSYALFIFLLNLLLHQLHVPSAAPIYYLIIYSMTCHLLPHQLLSIT